MAERRSFWMLAVITSEGEFNNITVDELDSILHPESNGIMMVAGDDDDIAAQIREDLSRVGARYSEFVGGTVVLCPVECE